MRHTVLLSSFLLSVALAASACSLFPDGDRGVGDEHSGDIRATNLERVPDSLLAHLPEGSRSGIEEARAEESKARDESAAAQRATLTCTHQLKMAQQELEVAQAELKKAEIAVTIAEQGTQDDLDRAHEQVRGAQSLIEATRARITWRERDIDFAKSDEALQRAELSLAAAKVELAKARAVHELDRPEARKVNVPNFEREVRLDEESVSLANAKYEADRKERQIAWDVFETKSKAVPASYKTSWVDDDRVSSNNEESQPH